MSELFEKSIRVLELPRLLTMLERHAVSAEAKARVQRLAPADDYGEVSRLLDETDAARKMILLRGSPTFAGVKPVAEPLGRAERGGALNTRELLDIAGVLANARRVRDYYREDDEGTAIDRMFLALHPNRFLEEKITSAILDENEIADTASAELAEIRRHKRAAAAKGRQILQRIISSPSYRSVLQDALITQRGGRFVVPVKAECRGELPGLVHDTSSSGATLFIEPMGVVQANNELKELEAKEEKEIDRILYALSSEAAGFSRDILWDYDLLVRLDLIFARGELSCEMNAMRPALRKDGSVYLRHARHPLLDPAKAVPIDIELGRSFDTLVITGPNTGGKTVSLKTLGLLCLMAQCGLHIPSDDRSEVSIFTAVLADIGDEQSIEQSLSTFSAHMKNIVSILDECDDRSLLLFDELGAGTDPTEGAALAIAIIENARRKGAVIAATTHYAELKVYATNEPGVQNASCEFDVETLRPTYHLLVGIPGKSNAFAISRRLGLSDDVIEDAKARVNTESASFEATIEKLEQTRLMLEKDRNEAAVKLRQAEESAKKAAFLRAELEVRLEKADQKSRREAERIIADARAEAEAVFAELDEMKKHANEDEDARRVNEARSELRRRLNRHEESLRPAPESVTEEKSARPVRPGDTVKIKSMGVKADVISVSPDRVLTLRAGVMNVTAKEDEVLLIEGGAAEKRQSVSAAAASTLRTASVASEIDLRGMEAVEGVLAAERYIDSAVMSRLKTVTIIHGKGTGVLRAAIQQMLKKNKAVKSFRLGRYGEGETGVTVVELK